MWAHLAGLVLRWKKYQQRSPDWDHDHCEFCGDKFMEEVDGKMFNAGWTDDEQNNWICSDCFEKNKDKYQFKVCNDRMVNQKKIIVAILEKAKTGLMSLEEFCKSWEQIEESGLTKVLYEDASEALIHLPSKSLVSKEIDFEFWRNQFEYRSLWLDLVLIELFDSESSILDARKKILPRLQNLTDAEIIANLKQLL